MSADGFDSERNYLEKLYPLFSEWDPDRSVDDLVETFKELETRCLELAAMFMYAIKFDHLDFAIFILKHVPGWITLKSLTYEDSVLRSRVEKVLEMYGDKPLLSGFIFDVSSKKIRNVVDIASKVKSRFGYIHSNRRNDTEDNLEEVYSSITKTLVETSGDTLEAISWIITTDNAPEEGVYALCDLIEECESLNNVVFVTDQEMSGSIPDIFASLERTGRDFSGVQIHTSDGCDISVDNIISFARLDRCKSLSVSAPNLKEKDAETVFDVIGNGMKYLKHLEIAGIAKRFGDVEGKDV